MSLASLLKTNHLSASAFIHPGQKIVVRGAASKAAAPHGKVTTTAYRVRAGDTLGSISLRYHTSVGAIARASKVSSRALIYPGQAAARPGTTKSSSKSSVPDTFNGVKYPRAVAEAAAHNRAILARRSVPSRSETKAMIISTPASTGSTPRSPWPSPTRSPAGTSGRLPRQRHRCHAGHPAAPASWASDLVGRRLDLLEDQDNITAGVVMLRSLGRSTTARRRPSRPTTRAWRLQQHGMYSDTKRYVRSVMALRKSDVRDRRGRDGPCPATPSLLRCHPPATRLIGRTLDGRYRVLRRLADGGMATVYLAVDERLDREVALKVMRRTSPSDESSSRRFRREARAAREADRTRTSSRSTTRARTTAASSWPWSTSRPDPARRHARGGPLTPRAALDVLEPVLLALAAAHRAGLIHRDVKPENVIIDDDGTVKVADFGLARAVSSHDPAHHDRRPLGTVAYLSPEQSSSAASPTPAATSTPPG